MLTTKVGPDGRILVPVELRRALRLDPGTDVVAHIENGRLVLERREQLLERAKARFKHVPRSPSLVDELIAERRKEAERESADSA